MLNSSPARSKMFFCTVWMLTESMSPNSARALRSTRKPSVSISASTGHRGRSTV